MHYNILNVIYYLIWGLQSGAFGKFSIKYCKILQKYVQLLLKIEVTTNLFSLTTYT